MMRYLYPYSAANSRDVLEAHRDKVTARRLRKPEGDGYIYVTRFVCAKNHNHLDMMSACLCEDRIAQDAGELPAWIKKEKETK